MVKAGEDAGLAVELVLGLVFRAGRGDQLGQHFLDRADATLQPAVAGLVDGAHAALADEIDDDITVAQPTRSTMT